MPAIASIIYMPMIPEAAIAMLACARLGITHSVVFGGFSAEALKARIQDLDAQARHHGRWRMAPRQRSAAEDRPSMKRSRIARTCAT